MQWYHEPKLLEKEIEKKAKFGDHYYGDIVRRFFFGGALVMLATLPFFNELLPVSAYISLLVIIVIEVVAGFTNPLQSTIAIIDTFVAVAAVALFEYYAVTFYNLYTVKSLIFWVNQLLAINFFFALYFSSKTLRGRMLQKRGQFDMT